ncbi:unnamed protein product, partial [marine sediment metagenome]
GGDDCSNVCMKDLVINAGAAATSGYIPPQLDASHTTDDIPPGATTTTVSPDEQSQIGGSGENLLPPGGHVEEVFSASKCSTEDDAPLLELAALGADVGDFLYPQTDFRSATGADRLGHKLEYYDANGDPLTFLSGQQDAGTTDWEQLGNTGIPVESSSYVYVKLWYFNLDCSEAWEVKGRQLTNGPSKTRRSRSAARPAEEDLGSV